MRLRQNVLATAQYCAEIQRSWNLDSVQVRERLEQVSFHWSGAEIQKINLHTLGVLLV